MPERSFRSQDNLGLNQTIGLSPQKVVSSATAWGQGASIESRFAAQLRLSFWKLEPVSTVRKNVSMTTELEAKTAYLMHTIKQYLAIKVCTDPLSQWDICALQ